MTKLVQPNFTQIPNQLLDNMGDFSHTELRVLLAAMRQTIGYHRESKAMSIQWFMEQTGLSRQGVLNGIEAAQKRQWLVESQKRGDRGVKIYTVEIVIDPSTESTELTSTSQLSRLDPVNSVDQSTQALNKEKEITKEKVPLSPPAEAMRTEPSQSNNGKAKKQTVPQAEMTAMKNAIAEAFGWGWGHMTKSEMGLVLRAAKELCDAGRVPDDIPIIYAYCHSRFDTFKPTALSGNATAALQSRSGVAHRQAGTEAVWIDHNGKAWAVGESGLPIYTDEMRAENERVGREAEGIYQRWVAWMLEPGTDGNE